MVENARVGRPVPGPRWETAYGEITVSVMGAEIDVEVEVPYRVLSPARPAKLYGPPEDCYPAEGAEIELADTFRISIHGYGKTDGFLSECSSAELRQLDALVEQAMADNE